MASAKVLEYLDQRIVNLSKGLKAIRVLQQEVVPEELAERLNQTELLLRGYIHQLEEKLHE